MLCILTIHVPAYAKESQNTQEWIYKADLPETCYIASTAEVNGKIYIIGGTKDGTAVNQTYFYDPIRDTWSQKN
ncbi:kelch repeat-containing protein [Bacillus swezeyi]|uniref:kelch repeat-containing protein n=1 Tax=Bacillus swezeyi TaxID=1925020 RepID=UPI001653CAF8